MSAKIKWTCVYKSNNKFDAEVVKGNLESNEIPCVLLNKQDSSYMSFGYVELHVPEEFKTAAENLIINEKKDSQETKIILKEQGLDEESASIVEANLEEKQKAKKDMLYGALWCIGGIFATVADIGFIFWGAILFGGLQFFKGLSKI